MASERSDEWSIPVARYPSPVCTVAIVDETPAVQAVNDPFESSFGNVDAGVPVAEAFDSVDIAVPDGDALDKRIVAGDQFVADTPDGPYRVETIPPSQGERGHLLFTERTDEDEFGVDNVASVVSHDLRNPLDVAKSRLRAGREFDEAEHFDHVAEAHERMERIIQDVLTLARGEEVVDPDGTVDLDTVARDAWETVDTGDATLAIVEPLPATVADADRVGRLFENLFRNCIEHGSTERPSRGGDGTDAEPVAGQRTESLDVAVGPLEDSQTDGFYVEDDGVGIPPAERDRVFEPGYSSEAHGTGLGLAIVSRIAALHGWSSSVTAGTDGGARIEVRGLSTEDDS